MESYIEKLALFIERIINFIFELNKFKISYSLNASNKLKLMQKKDKKKCMKKLICLLAHLLKIEGGKLIHYTVGIQNTPWVAGLVRYFTNCDACMECCFKS